jgi:thymidylate synthase, flavin-dependent
MTSNQNTVTLVGFYGGDETHSLSAWQSTNVDLDIELSDDIRERIHQLFLATVVTKKKTPEELLKMLAENQHHTPFEKSCLHFQLTADIASHIQNLKHRIGTSINGESARYKELDDKWYLPEDWNIEVEDKTLLYLPEDSTWKRLLDIHTKQSHKLYHKAVEELTPKLGRKRAKESARYFLNYNKQLDHDMMFNFRSFAHFQGLRNSTHAQVEIQEIAQSMLEQVKTIQGNPFKYTLQAFGF